MLYHQKPENEYEYKNSVSCFYRSHGGSSKCTSQMKVIDNRHDDRPSVPGNVLPKVALIKLKIPVTKGLEWARPAVMY